MFSRVSVRVADAKCQEWANDWSQGANHTGKGGTHPSCRAVTGIEAVLMATRGFTCHGGFSKPSQAKPTCMAPCSSPFLEYGQGHRAMPLL